MVWDAFAVDSQVGIDLEFALLRFLLGPRNQAECSYFEDTVVDKRYCKQVACVVLLNFIHFYVRIWLTSEGLGENQLQALGVKLVDVVSAFAFFQNEHYPHGVGCQHAHDYWVRGLNLLAAQQLLEVVRVIPEPGIGICVHLLS